MSTSTVPRLSVWTLLFAVVLGYVGGQLFATLLVLGIGVLRGEAHLVATISASTAPWWVTAGGFAGLWVGMVVTVRWAVRTAPLRWPAGTWRWAGVTDALYVGLGVVLQLLIDLAYRPFHLRSLDHPVTHLFGAAHGGAFVLIALMTAVGAPLVEESFFRGVLYRGLVLPWRERWGRRGVALATMTSGLLFGLAHGELVQLPGLVAVGVVLAVVYERTSRLLPSVLVHVGFNSLTLVALLAQRGGHL